MSYDNPAGGDIHRIAATLSSMIDGARSSSSYNSAEILDIEQRFKELREDDVNTLEQYTVLMERIKNAYYE